MSENTFSFPFWFGIEQIQLLVAFCLSLMHQSSATRSAEIVWPSAWAVRMHQSSANQAWTFCLVAILVQHFSWLNSFSALASWLGGSVPPPFRWCLDLVWYSRSRILDQRRVHGSPGQFRAGLVPSLLCLKRDLGRLFVPHCLAYAPVRPAGWIDDLLLFLWFCRSLNVWQLWRHSTGTY